MSNPIDWGNTPITVSLVRGIIAAILVGATAGLISSLTGNPNDQAIKEGIVAGIPTLLVLLGYGASDQNRANTGVAIAGDAPVQSVAHVKNESAKVVAAEVTADMKAKL